MSVLSYPELRRRVFETSPPLVEPCAEGQVQPNGVELTLDAVATWNEAGRLGTAEEDRIIPPGSAVPFDEGGWVYLREGAYLITFRETVHIPPDLCALGRPRSSLLRMGVSVATALWDSGYSGRSRALLDVRNPAGVRLRRGARVIQLVFFLLPAPAERLYQGRYQGER